MTTTVHTNISSTSVDGITVMIMMMVDIGKLGCCCAGVAVTEVVGPRWMDEKFVAGSANIAWISNVCIYTTILLAVVYLTCHCSYKLSYLSVEV